MNTSPKKFKMSAAGKARIQAAAKARWAKIIAAHPNSAHAKPQALEVLPPVKFASAADLKNAPKLKSGNDGMVADKLGVLYDDAQNGMRKIIALGLACWHIKEKELKHGEFGAWLQAHQPKLCRLDSATGKPKATSQLNGYMELAKGALEKVGIPTLEKYFATVAKFPTIGNMPSGGFLILHDKSVPPEAQPLREKLCALVDGKTQYALFTEFKQAVDDGEGVKKQHGRLPGSGGATKEQRANAAELEAQERITALKLKTEEVAEWLLLVADDKGLGEIIGTPELAALDKAMETARSYIKHHGGAK